MLTALVAEQAALDARLRGDIARLDAQIQALAEANTTTGAARGARPRRFQGPPESGAPELGAGLAADRASDTEGLRSEDGALQAGASDPHIPASRTTVPEGERRRSQALRRAVTEGAPFGEILDLAEGTPEARSQEFFSDILPGNEAMGETTRQQLQEEGFYDQDGRWTGEGRAPQTEFEAAADRLTPEERARCFAIPGCRDAVKGRFRSPGKMHEWMKLSLWDHLGEIGVSSNDIRTLRSPTDMEITDPDPNSPTFGVTATHDPLLWDGIEGNEAGRPRHGGFQAATSKRQAAQVSARFHRDLKRELGMANSRDEALAGVLRIARLWRVAPQDLPTILRGIR